MGGRVRPLRTGGPPAGVRAFRSPAPGAWQGGVLSDAEKAGYTPSVDRLSVSESPATAEIAERLGLAAGDPVMIRDRVCVIGQIQDPRKTILGFRHLFPVKVAMRLDEAEQVDMVLG